ncbi:winged helix-turn-helix domain-containing protein [Streptomyces sp. NPDC088748]|uniref:helix-turn-helix domain-containing protein n=1 Tax=Streptomyces sp. NPDC088748 TaxID=3365887 RepID=UPI0038066FF3
MGMSVATVWRLLKRHGWSWQAPARRALERDQHAIELWKKEVGPRVTSRRHWECRRTSERERAPPRTDGSAPFLMR